MATVPDRFLDPVFRLLRSLPVVGQNVRRSRLVLWIDEVGGFLVCLANRVQIGQAVPNSAADIALWADISREQATIARDRDGYTLEPVRETRLNGREIHSAVSLGNDSLIELGSTLSGSVVQFRFFRPHALCGSARLDIVSRHHAQPSVQGIVLMADACILGPASSNHVVCRNWTKDVVIFRQGNELFCRTEGKLIVDGREQQGRAQLTSSSHIEGEGFSLSLEPV